MKKTLKRFVAIAVSATMLFGMTGCAAKSQEKDSKDTSDGKVKLTFWSWLPTNDQSDEMIKEF